MEYCRWVVSVCLYYLLLLSNNPLHQAHMVLRGTIWALPPDSPNPSDDRPSQAYSMTLEDKAPVPPQLFRTSPSPQKHTLALFQPWGHWLTQAKTGCTTCNPTSPKWSHETQPAPDTPLIPHSLRWPNLGGQKSWSHIYTLYHECPLTYD